MTDIHGFRANQPTVWYARRLPRSNQWCPYCGRLVGVGSKLRSDKEHLIGRNFVPTGTLANGAWNFILRSCRDCNAIKAEVERHISSVTLFTSAGRAEDASLDALAVRKASADFHPDVKGVTVASAFVESRVEVPLAPGGRLTLNLVGPPQLNRDYVRLLATRQIQALFALITTEDPRLIEKTKILPADRVVPFGSFNRLDWGNPHLRELERRTKQWQCCLNVVSAEGFFKGILRRPPRDEMGWFWALEWNRSLRIVGAIFEASDTPDWFQDLPELDWRRSRDGKGRIRTETPLPEEEEDTLFSFEDV
jgi:hypothetical protein